MGFIPNKGVSKMKIQEIFNEYIELLPYMVNNKHVFVTTTLYNSYIKTVFGQKEVSILLLTDYQEFANNLLLPIPTDSFKDDYLSIDRIKSIIDILVSINRYAIKSNYGITENLATQIELDSNQEKEVAYENDLKFLIEDIEFIDNLNTFSKQVNEVKKALLT